MDIMSLILFVAVIVICWVLVTRFSPDPTLTLICQIGIFVVVVYFVVTKLLPLIGFSL